MAELDDARARAATRDRRRASRIRNAEQTAVDVPIYLVRGLLADATPDTRREVEAALGPKTFAALSLQLASAS